MRIQDDAVIAAVQLSSRYITSRFLPDKAIDLMDEAAAKFRIERNSMPEELDDVTRRLRQLEIEREAIKREKRPPKIRTTRQRDCRAEGQGKQFRAKWESEKALDKKIQKDKEEIENSKFEAEKAEREGNYEKVAEIRYAKVAGLGKMTSSASKKQLKDASRWRGLDKGRGYWRGYCRRREPLDRHTRV